VRAERRRARPRLGERDADDSERDGALTGSAGGRYRPGTVQAHHFLFMDPA